jgi:uncharacterized protein YfbU (UPF0304 family)
MNKFTLNQGEMMEILDPLNQNAYDKLQGAIEQKICEVLSEKKWLEIWEEGDWKIELSITFNNIKELSNA